MTNEKSLVECYTDDIAGVVGSFADGESAGKQSLQQLLTSDPQAFCTAGIRVLGRTKPSAGTRHLAQLVADGKHSVAALLDSSVCLIAEAVVAARAMAESGKKLETALEMALGKTLRHQSSSEHSTRILRILDLLDAISAQGWWNSFQVELMAYPDKIVRSKAALLIGRSNKNSAWIGRRLMDRDLRVQANAVEALWQLDAAESKPLLQVALKSKNNRVAGNAALGLYRIGDLKAVRSLMEMAGHKEPLFRLSAFWAIGETQDPRFLPFLAEQFKTAQGKLRLAVTNALARVRRREKAAAELGTVQIHVSDASLQAGGRRRLLLSLSKTGVEDLTGMKALEIVMWEAGTLVEEYELKSSPNPALVIAGFIAPRFLSNGDPCGNALLEGWKRCLSSKRSEDLWRIDRYALEPAASSGQASGETSSMPYDDSLVTEEIKMRHGCIADGTQLEKAIALPVPREQAAPDLLNAILRQGQAVGKHAGKRHVIVLLDSKSAEQLRDEAALAPVQQLIQDNSIVLHGVCLENGDRWSALRSLCQSTPQGSFHQIKVDQLSEKLQEIYLQQFNRYEIGYSLESRQEPGTVSLKIYTSYGGGQTDFAWNSSATA